DVENPERCHDHPESPERWPELAAVLGYRDRVREAVARSVDAVAGRGLTDVMAANGRVFSMTIEHELMHQETLLYMIQQLGEGLKVKPAWLPEPVIGGGLRRREIDIAPGTVMLGAAFEVLPFGWDNEFPTTPVDVPSFAIDSVPVSNGEFLEFVAGGGYRRPELWRPEDWAWKSRAALDHPTFWVKRGRTWYCQSVFDLLSLSAVADWPAYVSLAEARAYARWRGGRLPTEPEFHRAAYGLPGGGAQGRSGQTPSGPGGNFDFRHWAPTPIGRDADGANAWGVHELIGNGWEWTDTAFEGLPGFKAYIDRYPGY